MANRLCDHRESTSISHSAGNTFVIFKFAGGPELESSTPLVHPNRCSLTVPLLGPFAVLDSLLSQIPERRFVDEYSCRADPETDWH